MDSSNHTEVEMLEMSQRLDQDDTSRNVQDRNHSGPKTFNGSILAASDLENGPSVTSAFTNEDVHSVAWQNLTVSVTDRVHRQTKTILDDVSGIAFPGQMMAIMGPSGSGKTTLLNALAQRGTSVVEGKVLINGAERSLDTHRAVSSYIEQEDTLIGSLNTQETLRFAARLALPRSLNKKDIEDRVQSLIGAFGLQNHTRTLIGTPLQKGLSGGQKRRVSVATELITAPRILYLDEPTSGLDSTASYEIMSYIQNIAKQHKLIVIASIHQPSTKTFELFDQIVLLSQGRTCYFGPVIGLPRFLEGCDMPVPPLTNTAEHALDVTNVDFSQPGEAGARYAQVDLLITGWTKSEGFNALDVAIRRSINRTGQQELPLDLARQSSAFLQLRTLIHRAWIKSFRDIVAYWIRVVMYIGLAIMMGTVWLRLGTHQRNIHPFINVIFFGSAFMSFMAVAYVPAFLEDRSIFVKERANGLYGPTVFLLSNFIVGLPYLFFISILFSIVAYWLSNFTPTARAFFTWILWLFLDLVAAESLVVLVSSLFPNFVLSLALIAFANGLWMCVGGFLVSLPILNVFWKYVFHYIDYQAYVFQGMMVNEFQSRSYDCEIVAGNPTCHCMYQSELESDCRIAGTAVLSAYGYATGREGKWVGIMIGIIVAYRLLGWLVTYWRNM